MILVHIFNGKGKLMVAVIFRPEILNYLVLEVLPLGKRELPGLDSQAGETVKVLSKATKINTK